MHLLCVQLTLLIITNKSKIEMKALKLLLISLLPTGVMAQDYIFKVDEQLNANVSDTLYYEGDKMDAYQDAKTWLLEQKWTVNTEKDEIGEGFEFNANMMTKFRYNPIIKTSYADFVSFKGQVIVEEKRVILQFKNIQFGEAVKGIGEKSKTQPLAQKIHKLNKEKRHKSLVETDDTLDKKTKKKKIAEHDDVIKDIESSLKEVDEEFRVRIKNLHNSI